MITDGDSCHRLTMAYSTHFRSVGTAVIWYCRDASASDSSHNDTHYFDSRCSNAHSQKRHEQGEQPLACDGYASNGQALNSQFPCESAAQDDFLRSATKLLHRHGYQATVLAKDYQVIDSILNQRADLLIIHLATAGTHGYRLCQMVRQLSSADYLPIVFVGARASKQERLNALRCGGNDYLQLPVDEEDWWLSLQQHLNTAQLIGHLQADKNTLRKQVAEYCQILERQERLNHSLKVKNQALQKFAFIDGLTQVANRRGFNQNIVLRWQQAYSKQQPLSLLLCDIDYFKRYNDTYGHLAGDECLRAVAAALTRSIHRTSDQVARYGGEEFAIVLPDTDLSGVQQIALAVQSEVARAQIPHRGSLIKPCVSLSIGIFTMVPKGPMSDHRPHEVLVQGADEALYTAKLWGRDRTVINTANGCIALAQNYCFYDYTRSFPPVSDTLLPAPLPRASVSQNTLDDNQSPSLLSAAKPS